MLHRCLLAATSLAFLVASLSAQSPRKTPQPRKPAAHPSKGLRQHERLARPANSRPVAGTHVGPLAVALEVERNDTIGFADRIGVNPDYDGDISVAGDSDCVAVFVSEGVVTFDVSASGGSPISDPTLTIQDANGQFVAFNDDRPTSLYSLITISLPTGQYYATVRGFAGFSTGSYKLTVSSVAATFPQANLNGANNGTVPAAGETAFKVRLLTDTQIRMTVAANGGQDLYCALLRPSGAVQRFVDDGVSAGLDPSLETHLPLLAGVDYVLVFGDLNGIGGAFTFNMLSVAGPVPSLACGSGANGTVAGNEGEFMRKITLGSASSISLSVTGAGMTDSWINLYDASLNRVLYNDDSNNTLFSLVNVGLPAGNYYVGVEPYDNFSAGGFVLNLACTPGFTPTAGRFGDNTATIAAAGDTAVLAVTPGTPIALEASVALGLLAPMASILDAAGNCLGFSDFADSETIGNLAGNGAHWVLVRDYFADPGTVNPLIAGPLYFFANTKGTLSMQDKAGRIHFVYAAGTALPGGFPVPAPFTGNLLMLPPLIALPPVAIPVSGTTTYPAVFPNAIYLVQAVSVFTTPTIGGAMTNVAQ